MTAIVYEGTWEELKSYEVELRNSGRLRVTTIGTLTPPKSHFKSPQEQIAALDALAEELRGSPYVPDCAFDRENLYD